MVDKPDPPPYPETLNPPIKPLPNQTVEELLKQRAWHLHGATYLTEPTAREVDRQQCLEIDQELAKRGWTP